MGKGKGGKVNLLTVLTCLLCAWKEVCKPNNITDHRQAMDDSVAAAVFQQANKDVDKEPDTATASSDEQQPTSDDLPSLETDELAKEDLWYGR